MNRSTYLLCDLCLLILLIAVFSYPQEKRPLALDYPDINKKCSITKGEWNGRADWKAKCTLRVSNDEMHIDLFDLELIAAHPATLKEAQASVERWMSRTSVELLKRNGYTTERKKK